MHSDQSGAMQWGMSPPRRSLDQTGPRIKDHRRSWTCSSFATPCKRGRGSLCRHRETNEERTKEREYKSRKEREYGGGCGMRMCCCVNSPRGVDVNSCADQQGGGGRVSPPRVTRWLGELGWSVPADNPFSRFHEILVMILETASHIPKVLTICATPFRRLQPFPTYHPAIE